MRKASKFLSEGFVVVNYSVWKKVGEELLID